VKRCRHLGADLEQSPSKEYSMKFKTQHDSDNPITRLAHHWGIPPRLVLIESKLDVAADGFPVARLSVRIDDSAFRAMGGEPTKKELTVKLDATDALDAVCKVLEPGAVLLSAEAVTHLYGMLDAVRSLEAMNDLLLSCGGIMSTRSGANGT
jgi:hypothetical protein